MFREFSTKQFCWFEASFSLFCFWEKGSGFFGGRVQKVSYSRQEMLLGAPGGSEAGKVAVWKDKSCCGHPDTNSQTRVKEHQRRQTSLKF